MEREQKLKTKSAQPEVIVRADKSQVPVGGMTLAYQTLFFIQQFTETAQQVPKVTVVTPPQGVLAIIKTGRKYTAQHGG